MSSQVNRSQRLRSSIGCLVFASLGACAARAEVPVLAAPRDGDAGVRVVAAPTPSSSAQVDSEAPPRCLDAKVVRAAHDCPKGAHVDYATLLRAQAALPQPPPTRGVKRREGEKRPADRSARVARRPFTSDEIAYVEAAQRFVCAEPDGADRREVAFSLARTHFEAHHWEEAAVLFHDLAESGDLNVGSFAVQLSLESLNVLGAHEGRPDCFELLVEWTNRAHDAYCGAKMRAENGEMCVTLGKILVDLTRSHAG